MAAWGGWRAFGAWLDCSVFPGGGPLSLYTTKTRSAGCQTRTAERARRPCAARSGVATLLLPKDAANWSADEPERVMPCIGLWLLGGGAAAAPMSRKRTSLERAGDSDAQLDSSAPLSQEKRPRVALLSVHFEGNLGDEYETTPLLQRLLDWGAEVDAYSDPWLDPTDQSIAHTRTRELKFVNTFYTSDQWLTDSESLLSSDPPTLPGGLYDILIIAPGPGSPPLRLSSILKLARAQRRHWPWSAYRCQEESTLSSEIGTVMATIHCASLSCASQSHLRLRHQSSDSTI